MATDTQLCALMNELDQENRYENGDRMRNLTESLARGHKRKIGAMLGESSRGIASDTEYTKRSALQEIARSRRIDSHRQKSQGDYGIPRPCREARRQTLGVADRQRKYGESAENIPSRQQQYVESVESMLNRQQQYTKSRQSMPARQQQYGRSAESMLNRQQQYGRSAESMLNRQQQYGGSIESMPAQRQRSLESMASSKAQRQRSGESMASLTAQHQRSLESMASSIAQHQRSLESMASSIAQHQRSGESMASLTAQHQRSLESMASSIAQHQRSLESMASSIAQHQRSGESMASLTAQYQRSEESMHRMTSYSRYFGPNLGPPGDESPATRGPSSTVESEAPAFSPAPDRIATSSPNLYKAYNDPNNSSSLFSTPSIGLAGDSEDSAFWFAHTSPDTSPASSRAATLLLTSDSESEQEPELLDLSAVLARSELKTLPYSDPHYSTMTSSTRNRSETEPQVTPVDTRKLFSLPGNSTIVHSQDLDQDDLVQAQCHSIPPPEEMEYPSEAHLLKGIEEWGHANGCQLVKTGYRYRERKLTSIQLKCKRNGVARKRDRPRFTEAKPRQRTTMKIGCRMYVTAKRCGESEKWRVHCNEFASLHNHAPDHASALTSHRLKGLESFVPEIAREAFLRTPTEVMASLRQSHGDDCIDAAGFTKKDIANVMQKSRQLDTLYVTSIQRFQTVLDNNNFYYRFKKVEATGELTHILLMQRDALAIHKLSPDVLSVDCTYKTNVYNMPLLNVVGKSGSNVTTQLAIILLRGESQGDYEWAFSTLKTMLTDADIQLPSIIATDRSQACIAAIQTTFPASNIVICMWHIMKAVLTKARKEGGEYRQVDDPERPGRKKDSTRTEEFIEAFKACLDAPTLELFQEARESLEHRFPELSTYLDRSWWPYAAYFCKHGTSHLVHLGELTTSRVEGAHSWLKVHLRSSKLGLLVFLHRIIRWWKDKNRTWRLAFEHAQAKRFTPSQRMPVLREATCKVYPYAIETMLKSEWNEARDLSTGLRTVVRDACSCAIKRLGMPCRHDIAHAIVSGISLDPRRFHVHWWVNRCEYTGEAARQPTLQEPARLQDIQSTGSTSHSAGHGESSTRRNRSQFELVDENLSAAPARGSPPRFRMPGRPETHWRVVYQDPPKKLDVTTAAIAQRYNELKNIEETNRSRQGHAVSIDDSAIRRTASEDVASMTDEARRAMSRSWHEKIKRDYKKWQDEFRRFASRTPPRDLASYEALCDELSAVAQYPPPTALYAASLEHERSLAAQAVRMMEETESLERAQAAIAVSRAIEEERDSFEELCERYETQSLDHDGVIIDELAVAIRVLVAGQHWENPIHHVLDTEFDVHWDRRLASTAILLQEADDEFARRREICSEHLCVANLAASITQLLPDVRCLLAFSSRSRLIGNVRSILEAWRAILATGESACEDLPLVQRFVIAIEDEWRSYCSDFRALDMRVQAGEVSIKSEAALAKRIETIEHNDFECERLLKAIEERLAIIQHDDDGSEIIVESRSSGTPRQRRAKKPPPRYSPEPSPIRRRPHRRRA